MMEVMKCNLCGKLAMIIQDGGRRTICCDQLMEKLPEQGGKPGKGYHIPVVEKTKTGIAVTVSGVENPMAEDHFIEWIEVSDGMNLAVRRLAPGDAPEADFPGSTTSVKVRAYCPEHGLWSNKPAMPKT
jgi:superoxide reductase